MNIFSDGLKKTTHSTLIETRSCLCLSQQDSGAQEKPTAEKVTKKPTAEKVTKKPTAEKVTKKPKAEKEHRR